MNSNSPAKLWSEAFVLNGVKSVYRYTYGISSAVLSASEG
jgi:hypothetical protein